jgi:hypothetical protein
MEAAQRAAESAPVERESVPYCNVSEAEEASESIPPPTHVLTHRGTLCELGDSFADEVEEASTVPPPSLRTSSTPYHRVGRVRTGQVGESETGLCGAFPHCGITDTRATVGPTRRPPSTCVAEMRASQSQSSTPLRQETNPAPQNLTTTWGVDQSRCNQTTEAQVHHVEAPIGGPRRA